MIRIVEGSLSLRQEVLADMRRRAADTDREINETTGTIMEDIRKRGYEAVCEYSIKFDGEQPYELSPSELSKRADKCPRDLYKAMETAAENIRDYQSRLVPQSSQWHVGTSSVLGQTVRGLSCVGLYVPGGRAAYPSTVLMTAVPAKVAGVGEIVMVTPPTENLNNAVLAAAKIVGVDKVIALGGVQAVGALTYGAGFIPRVDKLVGPGNAYVAAAKRMAYGKVDIDMVAGPSEVLIIADDSADPRYLAADLMSQAEHDPLASAILVTTSRRIAIETDKELERQLQMLKRTEIIEKSIKNFGAILLCGSMEEAAEIADDIAPEHLEIITKDPRSVAEMTKNAGAIFLGAYSPEPLGDYMAGPSHVLPTSGTARFFSPLSVDSFLKKTSIIEYSKEDLDAVGSDTIIFAQAEGLDAHAASIRVRIED